MGSNKGNAMRAVIRAVIRAARCGRRDVGDAMGTTTRSGSTTSTSSIPSNQLHLVDLVIYKASNGSTRVATRQF